MKKLIRFCTSLIYKYLKIHEKLTASNGINYLKIFRNSEADDDAAAFSNIKVRRKYICTIINLRKIVLNRGVSKEFTFSSENRKPGMILKYEFQCQHWMQRTSLLLLWWGWMIAEYKSINVRVWRRRWLFRKSKLALLRSKLLQSRYWYSVLSRPRPKKCNTIYSIIRKVRTYNSFIH